MRTILLALVLAGGTASADGFYVDFNFGGAAYRGDIASTESAPRFEMGAGYIHKGWGFGVFGAGLVPDFGYIDCYGAECAYAAKPVDGFGIFGADVRRGFSVVHLRGHPRIRGEMFLHGGPRYFWGSDALDGYAGPGLGGGAGFELNLAIVSYYVDFGFETTVLHKDGSPEVAGSLPYIAFGSRFGWM